MQNAQEQISALVDDELDGPADALLERLLDDDAGRRQWSRYHLIGEVLRDRDTPINLGLASRIGTAIDTEPALSAPHNVVPLHRAPSHAGSAGSPRGARRAWAVAASLAAVGLSGVMLASRVPEPGGAPLAQSAPVQRAIAPEAVEPQVVSWDTEGTPSAANPQTLEFHRRLNSYLVNFNEQRANLGMPGVHPYVRIVGFDESGPKP